MSIILTCENNCDLCGGRSAFKMNGSKKTAYLCLNSHNCGSSSIQSDCTDGKVSITCTQDAKSCNGNPKYQVSFGTVNFPICQKDEGYCVQSYQNDDLCETNSKWPLILGIAGGAALLLLLIGVAVICWRKRKNRKTGYQNLKD